LPAFLLLGLKDGLLRQPLVGQKALVAVGGGRRFTAPSNLGLMPFEGCQILQFAEADDDAVRRAFAAALGKADQKLMLGGHEVAVLTEPARPPLQRDVWTHYLCRPRPGVLVCATNRAYLDEVLKRIDRKAEQRALPADLPEWKQVNVKAPCWGVRHFRKETAAQDPSSPLRGEAAANVPDAKAVGLVFWYGPAAGNTATVRYLSGADDAMVVAAKSWVHPGEKLSPKFRQPAPGVVEVSDALDDTQGGRMFLFVLMIRLGHGIFL
jgi:hypothetical protein